MAKAPKVTVKDNGYDAMMKRLERADAHVTVGVHEEEGSEDAGDGATISDVAAFHEFGLGVPRRSFIGDWSDENEEANRKVLRQTAEAVAKGSVATAEQGLDRAGLHFVGEIQRRIRDGIAPELEDATIAQKGSATPLIDTGQLWQSIRHRVKPAK